MLTRLRIKNFKAWQDTRDIRLAPLTVFFGTNSSGKTSLLQFLLMLKQTVQSLDRRRVLNFGDSRSLVDLGVWPEMVFRHEPTRSIEFELEYRSANGWSQGPDGPEQTHESVAFNAAVGTVSAESTRAELKSFTYRRTAPTNQPLELGMTHISPNKNKVWLTQPSTGVNPITQITSAGPVRFNEFPTGREELRPFTSSYKLQFNLNQQLESLRYLAPLRISPSRLYVQTGDIPEDVGIDGESFVDAIFAAKGREFHLPSFQSPLGLDAVVAKWLGSMGLLDSFEIKSIAEHRKEYEVLIRTAGMNEAVNLKDVGFGISQVLPVLVQLLYVQEESTLIFEQPELHIHPKAQSALADIFIESLQMQEYSDGHEEGYETDRQHEHEGPRNIQLLVETHSEHFLRRLQRRIAEQKLDPAQVALYFCKPGPEGSTLEELKLDDYGNITNWPENFFGDEVGDLAAMTEAAMRRQLGAEEP